MQKISTFYSVVNLDPELFSGFGIISSESESRQKIKKKPTQLIKNLHLFCFICKYSGMTLKAVGQIFLIITSHFFKMQYEKLRMEILIFILSCKKGHYFSCKS